MSNDAQVAKFPSDSAMVTSLLSRQDEVISELDLLEARILEVIEDLNVQRKSENGDEEADVIPMDVPTEKNKKEESFPKAA
jgi:hypothetical protein